MEHNYDPLKMEIIERDLIQYGFKKILTIESQFDSWFVNLKWLEEPNWDYNFPEIKTKSR